MRQFIAAFIRLTRSYKPLSLIGSITAFLPLNRAAVLTDSFARLPF